MYYSNDYLMHYGVKGMKWGVRHDPERVGKLRTARSNYRSAKKQYNKDFNKAYNYSSRHPVSQYIKKSPTYAKSNERWDKAMESAKNVNSAKQELKNAKADYKANKQPLLTDKQKAMAKKIAIGAAVVAGVGLATYGGIKVNSIRQQNMASVAEYLNNNSNMFNALTDANGQHYYHNINRPLDYSKTTRTTGRIKNSILGPSLTGSESTTTRIKNVRENYLENINVGRKGKQSFLTKDRRKALARQYKDYSKLIKQRY